MLVAFRARWLMNMCAKRKLSAVPRQATADYSI